MKELKLAISTLTAMAFLVTLAINFSACTQQSPLQPGSALNDISVSSLKKAPGNTETNYPQYGTVTLSYTGASFQGGEQGYVGGTINIPNGSKLQIQAGSLNPPIETPYGADVTITMTVSKDQSTNTLLFEFGPSGCSFSPSAEVEFDYSDLGINGRRAKLFYIDTNGDLLEQTPDHVDIKGKKMMLKIDHFSRYLIGVD